MSRSSDSPRRIYILGDGSLFDEGVSHRLVGSACFQVTNKKYSDDVGLLSDLAANLPDTILINESYSFDLEHVVSLLLSAPLTVGMCVMVLRQETPVVDVFNAPTPRVTAPASIIPHRSRYVSNWDEFSDLMYGELLDEN